MGIGIIVSPLFSGIGLRGYSVFPIGLQVRHIAAKGTLLIPLRAMLVCVWHVSELCKKWDVSGGFSSLVRFITDTWKKNVFLWELTSFSYSSKIFPSREDTVMKLIKNLFFFYETFLFTYLPFHSI